MTADKAIDAIQKEINILKHADATCATEIDDWVMDHIRNIQNHINDYRNREFKASEPDPFN